MGPEGDGERLDSFLASQDNMPSRSACAKLIESGAVTINSTHADSKSEKVCLGDRIQAEVEEPEEVGGPLAPNPYIPLDIRFEDEYLIVLSKQAGLVCHPAPGHVDDTLANALVAHCGYGHLGMLQGEERPGIVHRLDRDTSGLMVAAKDDRTQKALQDLIRLRVLDRRYVVLVHGYVAPDDGTIVTGIARSTKDRLRMAVYPPGSDIGKPAVTHYRVLERYGYTTLVECRLETGRTHQIRAHMTHIGHPLFADERYGGCEIRRGERTASYKAYIQNCFKLCPRQALHAQTLGFRHPSTGQQMDFTSPLPDDMQALIDKWRKLTRNNDSGE